MQSTTSEPASSHHLPKSKFTVTIQEMEKDGYFEEPTKEQKEYLLKLHIEALSALSNVRDIQASIRCLTISLLNAQEKSGSIQYSLSVYQRALRRSGYKVPAFHELETCISKGEISHE